MTTAALGLPVGTVFADRYVLVRPLDTGGMADIYLARLRSGVAGFQRLLAIKLLKERYRSDPRIVEMFRDEARISSLLNHPNIVHVYDVDDQDGAPFIAMEYIEGEELSTLCRRGLEHGRFLPLEHAVDLVRQAAEGMAYFHTRLDEDGEPSAIVHRDISPSNLLVTRDGGLKIIDFGIARSFRARSHDDTLVPGKRNYMSPQQISGERVDARSDIFSLGIVLYEVTVGRRLFKGPPDEVAGRIARGKIKPPTFVRRDFPPPLEAVIMKALERHPDERYQNAYELANDLEEVQRSQGLRSGPLRIARYLDELAAASGGDRRPELLVAGQSWMEDDAEDALDFDRVFAAIKRDNQGAAEPRWYAGRAAPAAAGGSSAGAAALGGAPAERGDGEGEGDPDPEDDLGLGVGTRAPALCRQDPEGASAAPSGGRSSPVGGDRVAPALGEPRSAARETGRDVAGAHSASAAPAPGPRSLSGHGSGSGTSAVPAVVPGVTSQPWFWAMLAVIAALVILVGVLALR